jgi:hypothetical protein
MPLPNQLDPGARRNLLDDVTAAPIVVLVKQLEAEDIAAT